MGAVSAGQAGVRALLDPRHKFIITGIKNKLTDLCGNRLLQSDLMNVFCEMSFECSQCDLQLCPTRLIPRAAAWESLLDAADGLPARCDLSP